MTISWFHIFSWLAIVLAGASQAESRQSANPLAPQFERLFKIATPVVLCIDDKPTAGGQPSTSAYAKAAANGFRSVLTLRSAADGVDLIRERFMVERNKMRYFNIPATKNLPRREQIDEFLRLVRSKDNHPMLINCGLAERVAPLMMIFRIVEQGWSEERAIEEASRSGLKSDSLRKFADKYLAGPNKKDRKPPSATGSDASPPVANTNVYAVTAATQLSTNFVGSLSKKTFPMAGLSQNLMMSRIWSAIPPLPSSTPMIFPSS